MKPNLSLLMRKAWMTAKWRARHQGGSPRALLPQALREAWADQKRIAAEIAAQNARILACVAEIRAAQQPLAVARRQASMAALKAQIAEALAKADAMRRARQPARRRAA